MKTDLLIDVKLQKVSEALDRVRPFLNRDGGDVELIGMEDTKVYVKLTGTCNGCPMSFSTMKLGIEGSIREVLPEILEVINVESDY